MEREKSFQEIVEEAKVNFEKMRKVLVKGKISDDCILDYIVLYLAAMRKANKKRYDTIIYASERINVSFIEE